MSIVLVALPGAPKISEEVIQQDKEINTLLEAYVKEIVSGSEKMEMCEIMRVLAEDEKVRNSLVLLPLGALHSFLEEVYNKLKSNPVAKEENQNTAQDVAAVPQN
ncbi:protein phosphatase 1B [Caerostris extrusa]|uniref:Protein phosphatase 1B n=1 Tax=Caerostris extrusa TaxID=172846 RepID=A0AAV4XIZ5_CAEEX|nr:protein phosphatase 1B [Caerostris extrusa]